MNDVPVVLRAGGFVITTDRNRINPDAALALVRTAFWAGDMQPEVLARAGPLIYMERRP